MTEVNKYALEIVLFFDLGNYIKRKDLDVYDLLRVT